MAGLISKRPCSPELAEPHPKESPSKSRSGAPDPYITPLPPALGFSGFYHTFLKVGKFKAPLKAAPESHFPVPVSRYSVCP